MGQDAIALLISDHRSVENLFQQIEGGSHGRDRVVRQVVRELSIHDGVERELLYPFLRKNLAAEGEDLAAHSLDEHDDVARLLAELESAEGNVALRDHIVRRLVAKVRAHVQEEEQLVFPKLADAAGIDLTELGSTIQGAKARAPTHPHPRAPRSTSGAKVAGRVTGVMDRAKDRVKGAATD